VPAPAPRETTPTTLSDRQSAERPASAPATTPPATVSEPPPQPAAAAEAQRQAPTPPSREPEKNYRSDPRIELQALVWAPDAAERFVVINNRLIKEGGSIDTITVVRIDRDDVLLSEGGDRWHEKFKIR
jgi:hypothetical protein